MPSINTYCINKWMVTIALSRLYSVNPLTVQKLCYQMGPIFRWCLGSFIHMQLSVSLWHPPRHIPAGQTAAAQRSCSAVNWPLLVPRKANKQQTLICQPSPPCSYPFCLTSNPGKIWVCPLHSKTSSNTYHPLDDLQGDLHCQVP